MGGMWSSATDAKLTNIGFMQAEQGYDVTIVCCSDKEQAAYWQKRLDEAKGKVTPSNGVNLAVDEDWNGGAGNFLGTLYAWRKACALHKSKNDGDLKKELEDGASVAIFHTAGKGTRLAPLPGAENNNKPGVKLPAPGAPSILECVIRQTGSYAKSRKKRLSVFWGDQIFVPSIAVEYEAKHHVDILCSLGPMPDAEEWTRRGLEKYGLIAARADSSVAAMLEKVTHASATERLENLEAVERVGPSLGSFSLSSAFLQALDAGFDKELYSKKGKMDSDPHVWMAMTLDAQAYSALMVEKDLFDEAGAKTHHQRISTILESFDPTTDGLSGMFGAVDVGLDFSWWDFGLLKLYAKNSLLLTEDSEDGKLARAFFAIPESSRVHESATLGSCQVDATSVVSTSRCSGGAISGSSLVGVTACDIQAEGAVLVNVCAKKISAAKGAVAYNIVDESEEGITLAENEVRVGVFTLDKKQPYFEMKSNVAEIDGGKKFKDVVCDNKYSFQGVYDLNFGVNVTACAAAAAESYEKRAKVFSS